MRAATRWLPVCWEVYFSDPMQCQDEVQITVNGKHGTHALPQGKNQGTTLRFEVN